MKRSIMKSLSAILAVLLAMTLSFAVLAEESTADESAVDTSEAVSVEESADVSAEESVDTSADESAVESEDGSKTESSAESKDESKEVSKVETKEESKESTQNVGNNATAPVVEDNFPWARVITLIAIIVLIVVAIILSKTNTAIGQKINKFFKEYTSEIKKVSWLSPKDTMKATGVVLVFIIVAAAAIGLLDLGFTKFIQLLANIF